LREVASTRKVRLAPEAYRSHSQGRRGMKRVAICAFATLAGLCLCTFNHAEAAGPPTCTLHLTVELTPDVPDPSAPGFVSSLLGNHVGYRLTLIQQLDDSTIDVQLDGPGTIASCQEVVESMREDGRVQSIDVQET